MTTTSAASEVVLKLKRLSASAALPRYATDGAACFDLHALIEEEQWPGNSLLAAPSATFRTGWAAEVPKGWALMIYSRSGHGFKSDTRLANCVGVIDSDYRGELMVRLTCDVPNGGLLVKHGDRIAQAMLVPIPHVALKEVDELSDTARGTGGLGSTGA